MKALHSLFLAAALAPALLSASAPAHAWGAQGHRLVAEVADARLNPTARAEVDRLLATEPDATLASIAPWADQLRAKDPGLGRRSAGWHYVNIAEDNCHYEAPKHCRNGNCIVEALKAQSTILGDRSLTDGERLQALKFVVHLVGDIHQPMHAGYAHDKGGNDSSCSSATAVPTCTRCGTAACSTPASWTTRATCRCCRASARRSWRASPTRSATRRRGPRPAAAFHASWRYPATRKIGDEYTERYRPLAEAQLRLAGENLAQLLNRVLGAR